MDISWPLLHYLDDRLAAGAAAILLPLAVYILISGLDDLAADVLWLRMRRRFRAPAAGAGAGKRVALFIPCWHEGAVIGAMLEHNLSAIAWPDYEVFIGVYPNDPETADAVRQVQRANAHVHLAFVPHDGPTSKPDCLNWVYQQMLLREETAGARFDLVLVHDAEDLIHPEALARLAAASEHAGMAQLAVLPLPTSGSDWTHGVYCDDFAESQGKDLATRHALGAFVPSCGVGTSFRRDALEMLAGAENNRVFQPDALTEDYDIGLRLHRMGVAQTFVPLEFKDGAPVATREYFPRRVRAAIRQRTRWVTGNALQAWQRHGWPGGWVNRWYLWRDRKGLWGNPLSVVCNLLLVYGVVSLAASTVAGATWPLLKYVRQSPGGEALLLATSALLAVRLGFRAVACARVYGWRFAAGSPLRMLWGNWINCAAALRALVQYFGARLARRPLVWVKTEHAYPTRGALLSYKRRLGDILVEAGLCAREVVEQAARAEAPGRLGERLVAMGALSEAALYAALARQQALPAIALTAGEVAAAAARALPARLLERFEILPFRVENGALHIAGPGIPDDEVIQEIRRFTRLEPRFHLVPPSVFATLRPAARRAGASG